jgi:hypothetical protein
MTKEIREILRASADHALTDTLGLVALVVLLIAALHLPILF